jgi:hypothetical protein
MASDRLETDKPLHENSANFITNYFIRQSIPQLDRQDTASPIIHRQSNEGNLDHRRTGTNEAEFELMIGRDDLRQSSNEGTPFRMFTTERGDEFSILDQKISEKPGAAAKIFESESRISFEPAAERQRARENWGTARQVLYEIQKQRRLPDIPLLMLNPPSANVLWKTTWKKLKTGVSMEDYSSLTGNGVPSSVCFMARVAQNQCYIHPEGKFNVIWGLIIMVDLMIGILLLPYKYPNRRKTC